MTRLQHFSPGVPTDLYCFVIYEMHFCCYWLHLTSEGWPGWVDLGSCYISRWFTSLQTVTHSRTNWAHYRATIPVLPVYQTATFMNTV